MDCFTKVRHYDKNILCFLRRTSGKWPFWNSSFDEYAYGFGDLPDADHWLGLDRVSAFVERNFRLEMRIRLQGDFCVSKACSGFGDSGNWWGDWEFKVKKI